MARLKYDEERFSEVQVCGIKCEFSDIQLFQRVLHGHGAFVQYFRYLRYGVDNVRPALVVLPAVLL